MEAAMPDRKPSAGPLLPWLLLATAIFLIVRRPETGVGGWIFRGGLIAISLLWLAAWWLTRNVPTDAAEAADEIVAMQKALYSQPHEFRTVAAQEIPGLDLDFYDRTEVAFRTQGFTKIADLEDLTATRQFPAMRTFIRSMVGDDGAVQVGIYHLKMRGLYRLLQTLRIVPRNLKMIDLETEMSDGTFIVTANSLGSDTTGPVPGVARFQHALETGPAALLEAHRQQVQQAGIRDPMTRPVCVATLEELIASQHRLQAIKNRHKASNGYMDSGEFRRITRGDDSYVARELAEEFDRRRRG